MNINGCDVFVISHKELMITFLGATLRVAPFLGIRVNVSVTLFLFLSAVRRELPV